MRCAIVILNWNGASMLRRFLPSVLRHTTLPDCQVIVTDNGSTDDSLTVLRDEFPQVQVLPLPQNYGFAEGYNRALDAIDAQYCVLLNSDVAVTADWLAPLLDYLDAHPDTAAVQPKIRAFNNPERFEHAGAAGGEIDILGYPFCRGRILDRVETDMGQYDTVADCFWATGACLCLRTTCYKELGGLDADFFAHMEEIDLCWRMQSRGFRVACIPQSVVYHLGGGSLPYGNPRKTFLNFRNNLLMLYKNVPTARLLWLMPLRCALDWVAALNDLLHGRLDNARAIIRARRDYHRLKPRFRAKRRDNLAQTTVPYPDTITPRCILFDYFSRR